MMWTSHLSSFDLLEPHLSIREPSETLKMDLYNVTGGLHNSFSNFVVDYLKGSGIPCPTLFADAKIHFDPIVDLSLIDTPGFRSRVLCWATTGSPYIDAGEGTMKVSCFHIEHHS